MRFFGRGQGNRKETEPQELGIRPLPRVDGADPYANIVGYYATSNQPIEDKDGIKGMRTQLTEQYKDQLKDNPEFVEQLISRILVAREAKEGTKEANRRPS